MKTFEREQATYVATVDSRKMIFAMYFLRTFAIVFVIFLLFYLAQKLFIYSDAMFLALLTSNFLYFLGAVIILLIIQLVLYFYYELKNKKRVKISRREVIAEYAISMLLIFGGLILLYYLNAL